MIRIDRPGGAALVAALFIAATLLLAALSIALRRAFPAVPAVWSEAFFFTCWFVVYGYGVARYAMPGFAWVGWVASMVVYKLANAWFADALGDTGWSQLLAMAIAFVVAGPVIWYVRRNTLADSLPPGGQTQTPENTTGA